LAWIRGNYFNDPQVCIIKLDLLEEKLPSLAPKLQCDFYNLRSVLSITVGNYYEGLESLDTGIEIARKNNFHKLESKLLVNLTAGYARVKKYKKAIHCAMQVLKYDFPALKSKAYYNLYVIHDALGYSEKQYEFLKKSVALSYETTDLSCYAKSMSALITLHNSQDEFEKALELSISYDEFLEKEGMKTELIHNKCIMADILNHLGRHHEALKIVEDSLIICRTHGIKRNEYFLNSVGTDASYKLQKFEQCKKFIDNILNLSTILDTEHWILNAYKTKILVCEQEKDMKGLLEAYKEYTHYIDGNFVPKNKIDNSQNFVQFAECEIKEVQEINESIISQNEELEVISHMLAHELKTPIRNIGSFVTLLEKELGSSKGNMSRDYIDYLRKSTSALYEKLDLAESYLNYKSKGIFMMVNVYDVILDIMDNINASQFTLEQIGSGPIIQSNYNLIFNLFHNIFSFILDMNTRNQSKLSISSAPDNMVIIESTCDGIHNAFENYRLSLQQSVQKGGLNIHIAFMEKLVKRHKGRFSFFEEEESGTTFLRVELGELEN